MAVSSNPSCFPQILSSEDRRANYDQFGQTDENQQHHQAPHGFRHFHDSFYFDQSFFRFTQSTRDFTDSKHLLQYEKFMNVVVPDSFKRPYLIKITSEWCFSCIHIEPVWKEAIQDLEPLGGCCRKCHGKLSLSVIIPLIGQRLLIRFL